MARAALKPVDDPDADTNPTASERTPVRARLAEAIATVTAMEAEIADTNAALTKANDDYRTAGAAFYEAEQALDRAKPRSSGGYVPPARPLGSYWSDEEFRAYEVEQYTPPIPIADARAALAKAEDERDTAKRMVQFHKERLQNLTDRLLFRRGSIDDARKAVVRSDPALAKLAAESKRLATRAAAAAMAFEVATNGDVIQPDSPFYRCDKPSDYRVDFDGWAVSRAWREALEQLRTDPDAPLPA